MWRKCHLIVLSFFLEEMELPAHYFVLRKLRGTIVRGVEYCHLYPLVYTGNTTLFVPCATIKGKSNGCICRSKVVHSREVLSAFNTVAQRSPWMSVAYRLLKRGRTEAHTTPCLQNGYKMVGNWPPRKNALHCKHYLSIWAKILPPVSHHRASFGCASFGWPIASIEISLWRPLCLHLATTQTLNILPPLSDLLCLNSFRDPRKA